MCVPPQRYPIILAGPNGTGHLCALAVAPESVPLSQAAVRTLLTNCHASPTVLRQSGSRPVVWLPLKSHLLRIFCDIPSTVLITADLHITMNSHAYLTERMAYGSPSPPCVPVPTGCRTRHCGRDYASALPYASSHPVSRW